MKAKMKVGDLMTPEVRIVGPGDTVRDAARMMARHDCGVLPVGDNDRLLGMITDRDIAVRCVAEGLDPTTCTVRDCMTPEVKYCYDDEDVAHIADNMAELQVRRLPVVNHDKRLVGIIALGDIAAGYRPAKVGEALCGVSRPNL